MNTTAPHNPHQCLFLLGGPDLEMQEIRKVLEAQGLKAEKDFFDRVTDWSTAKLSHYQDLLDSNRQIVGIELESDMEPPKGYYLIDHHNELSDQSASIEQLAELFGFTLTRDQQLIAANDKGYIPAMKAMGATQAEIDDIRRRDRAAQGVTPEMEATAKREVSKKIQQGKVTVVKTQLNKFSPLTDRLTGTPHLLIYNDKELTYYGTGRDKLAKHYAKEIKEGRAYYGGQKDGYLGLAAGKWEAEQIGQQVAIICYLMKDLISRHIFLFPFKWENRVKGKKEEGSFEDRTNLDEFQKTLNGFDENAPSKEPSEAFHWERSIFTLNGGHAYNEYNYFYDFVREVLYDLGDEPYKAAKQQGRESEKGSGAAPKADGKAKKAKRLSPSPLRIAGQGKALLRHYELHWNRSKGLQYQIDVQVSYNRKDEEGNDKHGHEIRNYVLEVEDVLLNVYDTGVGVLTFFLANRDEQQSDPEDILRINQFGRRLAPPFLAVEPASVGWLDRELVEWNFSKRLEVTQKAELAQDIRLQYADADTPSSKEVQTQNAFISYQQTESFKNGPFRLPPFISKLFKPYSLDTQEARWRNEAPEKSTPILLKPVLDDRMFVLCWYGGMKKVKQKREAVWINQAKEIEGFDLLNTRLPEGNFWYRFLFVDGGSMSAYDHEFASKLVKKRSYPRWNPYTYFGISRYSLVCLTDSLEELRKPWVNAAFLPQHMESIYYKLFELCIIQRASVLRFSDEVTHMSHFSEEPDDSETLYEKLAPLVNELYKNYLRFINKIYFREVTAQEQGIELYDILQRELRIEGQVKDLDKEIAELHQYVGMLEERSRKAKEKQEAIAHQQQLEKEREDKEAQDAIEKAREQRTQAKLNTLGALASIIGVPGLILALYSLKFYEGHFETIGRQPYLIFIFIGLLIWLSAQTLGAFRLNLSPTPISHENDSPDEHQGMNWRKVFGAIVLTAILVFGPLLFPAASSQDTHPVDHQHEQPDATMHQVSETDSSKPSHSINPDNPSDTNVGQQDSTHPSNQPPKL